MNKDQQPFVPKTPTDFQKLKLEKLMQNPNKPVVIPESPREKKGFSVPEFVRNVMGSSAGAGSGEFHVYRHLRRKEYTRQKMIDEKGEKEKLDDAYQAKLEENKRKMEDKTAKNRAKRLKRKQMLKNKAKTKGQSREVKKDTKSETDSEDDDCESNEDLSNELQVAQQEKSDNVSCNEPESIDNSEDKESTKSCSVPED